MGLLEIINYYQKTGLITLFSKLIGVGYSGHGDGLNNPKLDTVVAVGPIPSGLWEITDWTITGHDKGPLVATLRAIALDKDSHRAGFLIHGDNKQQDHSASHGCIVASYSIRKQLFQSNQTKLLVKAGY